MEYPADFNTPAFPAGKSVALARAMAIGSLVLFFLIACICGVLLFASKSRGVNPYLVSISSITGQWKLIGNKTGTSNLSTDYIMQEAVVGAFAQNWLFISDNSYENQLLWAECKPEECSGVENASRGRPNAAICCGASSELYENFIENVMPDYDARGHAGERWALAFDTMQIYAVGKPSAAGGVWRLTADVQSNISGRFRVLAFAKVGRAAGMYPLTNGYYIADFNAYRIGK